MTDLVSEVLSRGSTAKFVARGGSMSPWIRDGDLVTVEPLGSNAPELKTGDVAAFRHPGSGRLRLHRVQARTNGGWLMQGDRTGDPDGVIGDALILGRVSAVERGGRIVPLTRGRSSVILARMSRRALDLRALLMRNLRRWRPGQGGGPRP